MYFIQSILVLQLMGGDEIYHYHTKIMMKEPKIGGSFEWHQDYGYAERL